MAVLCWGAAEVGAFVRRRVLRRDEIHPLDRHEHGTRYGEKRLSGCGETYLARRALEELDPQTLLLPIC